MTENTQTTAERIRNLIFDAIQDSPYGDESIVAAPLGVTIAAEIDALKAQLAAQDAALVDMPKLAALLATAERERDEARAEVERLRLPAEAWEAYRALWAAPFADPDKRDAAETRFQVAIAADSAARARAAKGTP